MKYFFWLPIILFLIGCQAASQEKNIIVIDGKNIISLNTSADTPGKAITETGIERSTIDRIEFRGSVIPDDFPLPYRDRYIFNIKRKNNLQIITPDGSTKLQTGADTVGEALTQLGLAIYQGDEIYPAIDTSIVDGMSIRYFPARDYLILMNGKSIKIKSTRQTVGEVLASAGLPLTGMDRSIPLDTEQVPLDGQIRVVRVNEKVSIQEKYLPYAKKNEYSKDQAAGTQNVKQVGKSGLAVIRIRTLYEDGVEVSTKKEAETVIKQPIDSVIVMSEAASIQSLDTAAGKLDYWRVVQMYTTSYSPCRSGTTKCLYGTASGLPVKRGVVAMVPSLFNALSGTKVYIPGYGIAVIGDVGGGFPDHRLWIDLGFSDEDYESWSGYHTVYFLGPPPAVIPSELN